MRIIHITKLLVVLIVGVMTSHVSAFAQENSSDQNGSDFPLPEPVIDWQKHVTDNQRLEPLGLDLMGDKIDYNNGSVVFEHTDISIPGNSTLSVESNDV